MRKLASSPCFLRVEGVCLSFALITSRETLLLGIHSSQFHWLNAQVRQRTDWQCFVYKRRDQHFPTTKGHRYTLASFMYIVHICTHHIAHYIRVILFLADYIFHNRSIDTESEHFICPFVNRLMLPICKKLFVEAFVYLLGLFQF